MFVSSKFSSIFYMLPKKWGGGTPCKRVDLKIGCFFKKENAANKCILTDRRSEDKRQKFLNETAFSWMI